VAIASSVYGIVPVRDHDFVIRNDSDLMYLQHEDTERWVSPRRPLAQFICNCKNKINFWIRHFPAPYGKTTAAAAVSPRSSRSSRSSRSAKTKSTSPPPPPTSSYFQGYAHNNNKYEYDAMTAGTTGTDSVSHGLPPHLVDLYGLPPRHTAACNEVITYDTSA
jgi:hypothetical protein